jgi:RNase adaptor protein for sRNA GlmZ degradation
MQNTVKTIYHLRRIPNNDNYNMNSFVYEENIPFHATIYISLFILPNYYYRVLQLRKFIRYSRQYDGK